MILNNNNNDNLNRSRHTKLNAHKRQKLEPLMALDADSTLTIFGDLTDAMKEEFADDSFNAKFVPCATGF